MTDKEQPKKKPTKKVVPRGRPPTGNNGERQISMNAMDSLLGVDRRTILRWVKEHNCPTVSNPNTGGLGWVFNVADVWAWHANWIRQTAVDAMTANAGEDGSPLDSDARWKLARAINAEIDLGIKQGDLVFQQDVAAKRDEEIGVYGQTMRSIATKSAKEINPKDQTRIKEIIERHVNAALKRLATGQSGDDDE